MRSFVLPNSYLLTTSTSTTKDYILKDDTTSFATINDLPVSMKENNGRASRRKTTRRLIYGGVGATIVAAVLLLVWNKLDEDPPPNPRLLRQARKHAMLHHLHDKDEAQIMKEVLAGDLQLIDVTVNEKELVRAPDNSYAGVYGKFCQLDWSRRKVDPSAVPMFRHLVDGSPGCQHPFTVNLKLVADLARHRDEVNDAIPLSTKTPKVLNFTVATFHESRCGSTLVANAVAAMDSAKHRSYSEAPPPAFAMNSVCGTNFSRCSLEQAALVLRDVIYLMSRSNDPAEERVFFKFQSATTKNVKVFQKAFPDVPWMFVYRDPVHVIMSHIKDDPDLTGRANCLRSHRSPPNEIREVASAHGVDDVRSLSMEEYCAVHLAAISESAVAALTDNAIPVNYEALPHILHEKILPHILGRSLTQQEIDNIEAISQNYSKGAGSKHKVFHGDSEAKEKAASPQVKAAAAKFLQPSFDKLAQHQPRMLTD